MSFIKFGNKRLRSEDIIDYGLSTTTVPYEKIYIAKERSGKLSRLFLGKIELFWEGDLLKIDKERYKDLKAVNEDLEYDDNPAKVPLRAMIDGLKSTYKRYYGPNKDIIESKELTDDLNAFVMKDVKYLYVTTDNGSNYQFLDGACEFNIFDKFKELDNIL